jgi:threonine/homoserine/homoserine lactone efflux protein
LNYVILIIAGVVMGLIAAVPVGPVNLICIRRTFAFGPLNGFMSGLGAALGDGVFAAITFCGLTWIAQLIKSYAPVIEVVGGCMLIYFGIHTIFAPPMARMEEGQEKGTSSLARAMLSTFALTVTNPATLLAFASMFASFRGLAGGPDSYVEAGFIVGGVVAGSTGWWLALTAVIGFFHAKIDETTVRIINRASGLLVATFGFAVLANLAWKVF